MSALLPAQLTTFVGRTREMLDVRRRLEGARVVTLVGPGGAGKTRLALEVAASVARSYADGVRFVDLVPLRDAELVIPAVAQAFGIRDAGKVGAPAGTGIAEVAGTLPALTDHLREKHVLVVLDNCEHVLGAVPALGELVRACPRLWLLATSRASLRLSGEHEYPVGALDLPDGERGVDAGAVLECDAVRLFVERARAVAPRFAPTPEDAPALAQICRRLDGLPLAIELAAARLKLFTPAALLARLEQRLPLLTEGPRDAPARHQTLRAALDWSYRLLAPAEQCILRRLGVFVGGAALEAAQAVCVDGEGAAAEGVPVGRVGADDVVNLLSALRNASLIELRQGPGQSGEPRVQLLETVREYALERLADSGELDALRRRHAAHYLTLAEQPVPDDGGGNTEVAWWLEHLETEIGNFRRAAEWFVECEDHAAVLRLGIGLQPLWYWRADPAEGRRWLERSLAAAHRLDAGLRAKALSSLAEIAARQLDLETALDLREQCIALARAGHGSMVSFTISAPGGGAVARPGASPHPDGVLAGALLDMGSTARSAAHYARARSALEEARSLFTGHSDTARAAICELLLGAVGRSEGDLAGARTLLERSLSVAIATGNERTVWAQFCEWNLANVACDEGGYAEARDLLRDVATHARDDRVGNRPSWFGAMLLECARWAVLTSQPEPAARLLAAARALRAAIHHPWPPVDQPDLKDVQRRLRAALAPERLAVLGAEGERMSGREALDYAVRVLDGWSPTSTRSTGPAGALTPRQREVAALVAEGLSNREIAARLTITERTAENHVQNVLDRLGFTSRSQVAAWAARAAQRR